MKTKNLVLALIIITVLWLAGCGPAARSPEVGKTVVVESPKVNEAGRAAPEELPKPGGWAYPTATPSILGEAPSTRAAGYEPVTAGLVDDNEQWQDYTAYLANHQWMDAIHRDVTERYRILVRDQDGQPVHDAQVNVLVQGRAVFEGRTDAGGLLYFSPNALYTPAQSGRYQVVVEKRSLDSYTGFAPEQVQAKAFFERYSPADWVIELVDAPIPEENRLDLLFLMDATGSMSDEIDKLKATMSEIANQINALPERPQVRYGLVSYRDRGDNYVVRTRPFTADLGDFQADLDRLQAGGGGDTPESVNEALYYSLYEMYWSGEEAVRMILLVADAPPHLDYSDATYTYANAMDDALAMGIKIFPIGASGLDDQGEYIFRQLAQYTGGKFVFLTYAEAGDSSSGPGGETTHDVSGYSVQTLDRLVVRLVTDELAKLPRPELRQRSQDSGGQGGPFTGGQSGYNPGFDPDNPVWFAANPAFGGQPQAWFVNGDFSNGLDFWTVGHGSDVQDTWNVALLDRSGGFDNVAALWRSDSGRNGGAAWLEQALDVDVSGYARLELAADLAIIEHSLGSSGWWCDSNNCDGEYPLRFSLFYQAADGYNYVWSWGFLTEPNAAQLKNYDLVPASEWVHFTSANLMDLQPRPERLLGLRISGAGWDFQSQVDNVELALEMP